MVCRPESRPASRRHTHHMPPSGCLPPGSMSDTMSNRQHVQAERVNYSTLTQINTTEIKEICFSQNSRYYTYVCLQLHLHFNLLQLNSIFEECLFITDQIENVISAFSSVPDEKSGSDTGGVREKGCHTTLWFVLLFSAVAFGQALTKPATHTV